MAVVAAATACESSLAALVGLLSLLGIQEPEAAQDTVAATNAGIFVIDAFSLQQYDVDPVAKGLQAINVGGATGGALLGLLTLKFDLKRLTIAAMIMSTVFVAIYGNVTELAQMTVICIACGFFINAAINAILSIHDHSQSSFLFGGHTITQRLEKTSDKTRESFNPIP